MMEKVNPGEGPSAGGPQDRPGRAENGPAWIDSRVLFGCRDEVVIKHGNQMYKLRITRYGKLILNK